MYKTWKANSSRIGWITPRLISASSKNGKLKIRKEKKKKARQKGEECWEEWIKEGNFKCNLPRKSKASGQVVLFNPPLLPALPISLTIDIEANYSSGTFHLLRHSLALFSEKNKTNEISKNCWRIPEGKIYTDKKCFKIRFNLFRVPFFLCVWGYVTTVLERLQQVGVKQKTFLVFCSFQFLCVRLSPFSYAF